MVKALPQRRNALGSKHRPTWVCLSFATEVHKVAHICNVMHAHHAGVDMRNMFCGAAQVGIPFREDQQSFP